MNIVNKVTEGCSGNCRVSLGTAFTTAAYYHPIYDKNGVNINPDMNSTTGSCSCQTCGKHWDYTSRGGETLIKQVAA